MLNNLIGKLDPAAPCDRAYVAAAFLAITTATACGNHDAVLRTGSDTTVVAVTATGARTLHAQLEFVLNADPAFGSVLALNISRDGSVYVIDRHNTHTAFGTTTVRRFDRAGRLNATLGRMGQGPGEFRAPGGVAELHDGRVIVADISRVLVFSHSGKPLGAWPVRSGAGNTGPAVQVDNTGAVHVFTGRTARARGSLRFEPFIVRLRADGAVIDTLLRPDGDFPRPERMGRVNVPFVPTYHFAWSPAGYYVTTFSRSFAVDLRRVAGALHNSDYGWHAGDAVTSLRRVHVPVRVKPQERADWASSLERFMRVAEPHWQWDGPQIPEQKPAIAGLSVDMDGRIWVRLHQEARLRADIVPADGEGSAERRWKEPNVYEVLRPDGQQLGKISLPDDITSFAVMADVLWAVAIVEDDQHEVRRYRLPW